MNLQLTRKMIKEIRIIVKRITKAFWIWAEFSERDHHFLSNIQKPVRSLLNSPDFDLHLTLAGPFKSINQDAIKNLKEICKRNTSIAIKSLGYEYKESFFESFYIAIKNTKELISLRSNIYEATKSKRSKIFSPHISLSYGDHDNQKKKYLISKLPRVISEIKIDKICIVDVNEDIHM